MFQVQPDIEGVEPLMLAVCPNEEDHLYLDVLAIEDNEVPVEVILRDFYASNIEDPGALALFLKSPYHVSWHTDPEGLEYRLVVIDNRHVASLCHTLSRLNSR